MSERTPCSALDGGACKNGFYVTAVCHGIDAEQVRPTCMQEGRCWQMYGHNGGVPKAITDALSKEQTT